MNKLKIIKTSPIAKLPTKAYGEPFGWDVYSTQQIVIPGQGCALVSTGLKIAFPKNIGAEFRDRSGFSSKWWIFVRAGIIDPDYRGELKVLLHNVKIDPYQIEAGEPIAQMVLRKRVDAEIEQVTEFAVEDTTERGEKGFGSSNATS